MGWIAWSQKPARQSVEQHVAPLAHAAPMAEHAGPVGTPPPPPSTPGFAGGETGGCGGSHVPLVQLDVQQSAPVLHGPRAGAHTTVHVMLAVSQCFEQQSPSLEHAAFCPRQAPGGRPHRPFWSHRSLSFVAPQQPELWPFPQSSPVGRQVEFARSTLHCFSAGSQTPEQQSALAAQVSPMIVHSFAAHTPPKHPSEQQSCAVTQATPSARHASRHWMTPAMPVIGSQRPLQQSGPIVQLPVVPVHARPDELGPPSAEVTAAAAHLPPLQVPEQQSKPTEQVVLSAPQTDAGWVGTTPELEHVPPAHAPIQQSEALTHPAPDARQLLASGPAKPGSPGIWGLKPCAPSSPPSGAWSPAPLLPPQFHVAPPPRPMKRNPTAVLHARFRSVMTIQTRSPAGRRQFFFDSPCPNDFRHLFGRPALYPS
jgi:hypothetical protein